jgi:V/A-type H+-transporting ATPase subunit B
MIGTAALTETDRRYLAFDEAFGAELADQGRAEVRSLDETLDRAWRVLGRLPRHELVMLPADLVDAHLPGPQGNAS